MDYEVEPRGIEPLYPNVKYGILAMRWPLNSTEKLYQIFRQNKKPDSR
jgi:hypothetical protein